jgi:hypothetical protein
MGTTAWANLEMVKYGWLALSSLMALEENLSLLS